MSLLWASSLNTWEIRKHSFLTELVAAADMTAETRYYICPMLISITTTHYSDQPEAIYNHLEASAHHFHNWLARAFTQQLVVAVNHCQRIRRKEALLERGKAQCLSIVGSCDSSSRSLFSGPYDRISSRRRKEQKRHGVKHNGAKLIKETWNDTNNFESYVSPLRAQGFKFFCNCL